MQKALESDVTTVIDVPISPEEDVFPMFPWSRIKRHDVYIIEEGYE